MSKVTLFAVWVILVIVQSGWTQVTTITFEELDSILNDKTIEDSYILLDVRDDYEVEEGIIASECSKPYHMSWNNNELQENYDVLPEDMTIIIYCRSGNRSGQAAQFLMNKGFNDVISLAGGISMYEGEIRDVSELKATSLLPEPSFPTNDCEQVTIHYKIPRSTLPNLKPSTRRFTLNGRKLQMVDIHMDVPMLMIEHSEVSAGAGNKKLSGIQRLPGKR